MLSILIPTYNTDITALVTSLLDQTREAGVVYELIFCEDASTLYQEQNSGLTAQPYVRALINKTNLGRTATRSKLAKNAQYDWLLFLDADVLIDNDQFIKNYLTALPSGDSIIVGGTSYVGIPPRNKELRWKYGIKREAKNAEIRIEKPSYIISQNILVKKEIFINLNIVESRRYGLDNIFSYQIYHQKINVLHIDNPIVHTGLEENLIFLDKSLQAIDTLIHYERSGSVSRDFTSLQQAYQKLRKLRLDFVYPTIFSLFKLGIQNNIVSNRPSLFLFDLFRLNYYIKSRKNA
ncbi:glycosyltransferase [uncultured Dokdonia sp.]|uniref:glycosyltransferase family 2 protein n=1 Tax=uncultured Dokdonia sp. TaxID=575653 RepID=UPI0026218FC8|nr:glycosyltransferase [uncultured Dokdonia sp.]